MQFDRTMSKCVALLTHDVSSFIAVFNTMHNAINIIFLPFVGELVRFLVSSVRADLAISFVSTVDWSMLVMGLYDSILWFQYSSVDRHSGLDAVFLVA